MASGDTAYIGGGYVVREVVTVAMTSAIANTTIIGDVDGAQTGDVGEVLWTNFTLGWNDTPSGSACLTLAGRDFLTFRNIHFVAGAAGVCVDGNTVHSTNIVFDNCMLVSYGAGAIVATASFATALNWTLSKCFIFAAQTVAVTITLTTGVGADFDSNVQITDSVIWSVTSTTVSVLNSGTAANKGGGVDTLRCVLISGNNGISTVALQMSTTIPSTAQDNVIFAGVGLNAGTAGQITDFGGNVLTGGLTNVTQHATTKTATEDFPAQLFSFAHEWMWGMQPRRFLSPLLPSDLSRGTIGTATTDMEGRARPEGGQRWIDSGTATAGATTTLTDTGKAWKTNDHTGRLVRITGGTGAGQVKQIASNTATVLTISTKDSVWATTPDNTSTYVIYEGPPATTAKATSGSTTTFVVSGASWSVNKWAGYDLKITAGTNAGSTRSIISHTATTLTTAAFGSAIDATSVGEIFWPGTSLAATQRTPGALERHDDLRSETTTVDVGPKGGVLYGPGSYEFKIPVDPAITTISIRMRYDANHGTTNKPQAILLANGEAGVATQTVTMTAAADTWETVSFAAFTPTAATWVVVRLVSRSDTPYGRAYADTWG